MRFHRLDLIKYGKFTDRSVDFPAAKHDFHLIVGPNEAGKSTLRSAIVDLLFGIHARSPFSFLHPLNQLRLGGSISNASDTLEFHRAKALRQTLRSPSDDVLPDSALTPFLGAADRNFFDQMFGLDHTRLVSGGNSILNAENDVGQILFQSAAGVASLGIIRDALIHEADKLWAPRRSNERAYYIATDQFDKAVFALKEATVRTKVWVEANSKVEGLQEALDSQRQGHQQLENKRSRLERIRRLAPFLIALRDSEQQLSELGVVIELPIDAANTLTVAERELAIAVQRLELRNVEVEKNTDDLSHIHLDEALLAMAVEISKLDNLRLQYSAYPRDIDRRKREKADLWQQICDSCTQLGWAPESEAAIKQCLPTLLIRRELRQLVRERGGISQALCAAKQAERTKHSEMESLSKQLAALQSGEVQPALRAALAHASSLGDSAAILHKQQELLTKAKSVLEGCLRELGLWTKPLPELIAIQAPSLDKVSRMLQERQALSADRKAECIQLKKQQVELARIELQISQFKELHHPTTHDAVIEARRKRDSSWLAIKTGDLQQHGQQFEETLVFADQVSDKRLDDVEEATELQSLQHQLERQRQSLLSSESQCLHLDAALQLFDSQWASEVAALDLADMPLEEIGGWLGKREKALGAAAVYQSSQNDLEFMDLAVAKSRLEMVDALRQAQLELAETDSLPVLCVQAERFIQAIDSAKVRHETLSAQWQTAQTIGSSLEQAVDIAQAEESRWTQAWSITLEKAGLAPNSESGTVEGALELIDQIAEKLNKITQIQVERIDTMNVDLKIFSAEADRLMQLIAPELNAESADQIAQKLAHRLTQAREAQVECERLKQALRLANRQVLEAKEAIQTATASLTPLMERANTSSHDLLACAIRGSDEQRRLNAEVAVAKTHFINGGDGLSRIQIETEIDAADLIQLAAELAQVNVELLDAVQRQNDLSADYAGAVSALSEIGGSDAASQAEAQRQEALAQMADVAERYVKVFTAGRLLRWSIDRYREEKQGPLLDRAGSIFSVLTSGTFQKLIVDFEREPMVLEGQRADGKLVGISGLSDGTRDQLYLALRLAALEMHLDQAIPLPFIADDLFINYDDVRSKAGFEVLKSLSEQTQVIFLSHHDHLIPTIQAVFGMEVNVVFL